MTELTFQDLRDAMRNASAASDWRRYFETEVELEGEHLAQAERLFAAGRFAEAAAEFDEVTRLNEELVETLQAALEKGELGDATADEIRDWRDQAHRFALHGTGQAATIRGLAEPQPNVARQLFINAESAFRRAADEGDNEVAPILAEHTKALADAAEGREQFLQLDFDGAAAALMRARVRLDKAAAPPPQTEGDAHTGLDLLPRIAVDAEGIAALYERAAFSARFLAGDYQEACEHATAAKNRLAAALEKLADEGPPWIAFSFRSQLAQVESERLRAEGALLREQDRWAEAQVAYESARRALLESAEQALQTGLQSAIATQEALVASASLTIGVELRNLRAERELDEEIARLREQRDELVDNLRSVGITVNSYAEAAAVAEQNTQVAVRVEQDVRNSLFDLEKALRSVNFGPEQENLLAEVAALKTANDPPASFLEKARRLTSRVAEIAKSVGDAAGPVLDVVRVLAPLVGVPLG